jgi:hypothetical protein
MSDLSLGIVVIVVAIAAGLFITLFVLRQLTRALKGGPAQRRIDLDLKNLKIGKRAKRDITAKIGKDDDPN